MMYPVMGRRYQYIFKPAHFTYQLGMYKDPPNLGQGIHEDDIEGLKAQVSQRNEIDKTVQRLKDRASEAHRKIHVLGGMVCDMDCPKKTYLMIPPVQPVIEKIFRQQQEEPIREDTGDGYPVMPVAYIQDYQIGSPEQEIDTSI